MTKGMSRGAFIGVLMVIVLTVLFLGTPGTALAADVDEAPQAPAGMDLPVSPADADAPAEPAAGGTDAGEREGAPADDLAPGQDEDAGDPAAGQDPHDAAGQEGQPQDAGGQAQPDQGGALAGGPEGDASQAAGPAESQEPQAAPAAAAALAQSTVKATAPAAPAAAPSAARASTAPAKVSYSAHVSNVGWKGYVSDGASAGGVDEGEDVEAIRVKLSGIAGGVTYGIYAKGIGWQSARSNASTAGTTGRALAIQALRAKLTGDAASSYDLYYRVYVRGLGWLDWASNWSAAGSTAFGRPLEGLQMRLVSKGGAKPAASKAVAPVAYVSAPKVSVSSHVQNIGWQGAVGNGKVSGTTGRSLRMEAVKISVSGSGLSGGASTAAHVQNVGWQSYAGNGKVSGTTGRALRLEAVKLGLTGQLASVYDVQCMVHVQNVGWMDWADAFQVAGTTGRALRLEAIRVKVGLKEEDRASAVPYTNPKQIMGPSQVSASKLASWYKSVKGDAYPSSALSKGGASTIEAFANIVAEEARVEGVRAEVVFAQMVHETGFLRYGNQVSVEQFNYCGLKNAQGTGFQSFPDVRTGVRAQVQHLKAYASTSPLVNKCVDPRFSLVTRGVAPTLDGLGGRWSTESTYGDTVYRYVQKIMA